MVHDVEGLRGSVHAELIVDESATQPILSAFGVQATLVGRQADGRSRVDVRAHTVNGLAEQLAGWATAAEVLGPTDVRKALGLLGRRIAETYGE